MTAAIITIGAVYLLWLLFVLTMRIREVWPDLGPVARIFAAPPALLAYLMDIALNYTLFAVLLGWPGRSYTLSKRLHYLQPLGGWRSVLAGWVCRNLLNPFDKNHC